MTTSLLNEATYPLPPAPPTSIVQPSTTTIGVPRLPDTGANMTPLIGVGVVLIMLGLCIALGAAAARVLR